MLFINISQRDILSIIADTAGLIGWSILGGFIIKKYKVKIRNNHNYSEKNKSVERKKIILWGAYTDWSKVKNQGKASNLNSSLETKTEEEIKNEI